MERLPYPPDAFAAVLCPDVLDFAAMPGEALLEFSRVTRPGGRLVLATLGACLPIKASWWRRFPPADRCPEGDRFAGNGIAPWEMGALLPALGWRVLA